jgi:hypothetical protein
LDGLGNTATSLGDGILSKHGDFGGLLSNGIVGRFIIVLTVAMVVVVVGVGVGVGIGIRRMLEFIPLFGRWSSFLPEVCGDGGSCSGGVGEDSASDGGQIGEEDAEIGIAE